MKITLNNKQKLSEIQDAFNHSFPYLKIEFFLKFHKAGMGSAKKQLKSSSGTLGECRTIQRKGTVKITPAMTVNELEQSFSSVYGLSVQVFRKSGTVWLETTATDGWTLYEQNQQGEELSIRFPDHTAKAKIV